MSNIKDHSILNSNIKTYIIGCYLSIILTIIPFWIVMGSIISNATVLIATIIITAIIQIIVHLVCFLHIDTKSNEGWDFIVFVFAMIIIAILVVGSIWIMWNLNYNMMVH